MSSSENFGNPLRKFKLVFLGEQSGTRKKLKNRENFHTKKDISWIKRKLSSAI